ncbi:MAG: hypothetical protein M3179_02760 [Actinomycetota bacterium]|nr:hypothetical protein [Actinomycetota bacterium]
MRNTKRRLAVAVVTAVLAVLGASSTAYAARADGVCGGTGTHYDPVTGECV